MFCDEYKKDYRRAMCNQCNHQRGDFKLLGIVLFKRVKQCNVCKCSVDLKTMWADSKCPKGKW